MAETKGKEQDLRDSEKWKIACGRVHFKQLEDVEFPKEPVSSVSELMGRYM